MVYGVVMYDFKAERPDELEAKEGEAIIVIAQSNPEWFVAKPITRLGGPGLIPVAFIEIRDMTTGKAVTDSQANVQKLLNKEVQVIAPQAESAVAEQIRAQGGDYTVFAAGGLVTREIPLDRAADALALLESGESHGKILLTVD